MLAQINEKTFKQYLETYKSEFPGTGMKEVKKLFSLEKWKMLIIKMIK